MSIYASTNISQKVVKFNWLWIDNIDFVSFDEFTYGVW